MSRLSTAKMTSKQFLMLGEDPPGLHLELAHGQIVVSPRPTPRHSEIIVNLLGILREHIRKRKLGRLFADADTVFDDENTRRPDILFFSKDRLHLVGEQALQGPPDLCVEVLSPSSVTMDREDKFELFAKRDVPNYWIVDPTVRTLEAFVLKRGKYVRHTIARNHETAHLPPFLDLAINLSEVWPEAME